MKKMILVFIISIILLGSKIDKIESPQPEFLPLAPIESPQPEFLPLAPITNLEKVLTT